MEWSWPAWPIFFFILFEPGLVQILVIWALSGLGWGTHWLIDQALWAKVTPDHKRGRVFSLAEAAVSLAAVAAALFGGWPISSVDPVTALAIISASLSFGAIGAALITGGFRTVSSVPRATVLD